MQRLLIILMVVLIAACTDIKPIDREFLDISKSVGISFATIESESRTTTEFKLLDILGGGVGVLDIDGDGDLDLIFVQGSPAIAGDVQNENEPTEKRTIGMWLFRNVSTVQAIRFEPVVDGWPEVAGGFGMGVAIGDVNNDGNPDIYIATSAADRLLVGAGDGRFEVIQSDQFPDYQHWSVSASLLDINADGFLDIYTAGLITLGEDTGKRCYSQTGSADYCSTADYSAAPDRILINQSTKSQLAFSDESDAYGINKKAAHAAGVTMGYVNNDDWPDLFIANDGDEDALWINKRGTRFVESARQYTVSRMVAGNVLASRGAKFVDYDRDGDLDLLVAAGRPRGLSVYERLETRWFRDVSVTTLLARLSVAFESHGIAVDDFNADGFQDIAVAHGATMLVQEQVDAGDQLPLRQADQLYYSRINQDRVEFHSKGMPDGNSMVSRGIVQVDLDNDGDADLVRFGVNRAVRVLENTTNPDYWFGLVPRLRSGRIAVGARVRVPQVDGAGVRLVSRDGSYASSGDPRLRYYPRFRQIEPVGVTVVWPNGEQERFSLDSPSGYLVITQGTGGA